MEEISLSNALFSKVQQRVLALIFGQPERSFYMSEIVRNVHSGTGAVERELSRLQRSGLVSVERIGNQKHYRANHQSPIFAELQGLVIKTVALTEPLRKSLEPCADKISAAFVYGSVAKGTDTAYSDIDLMVIGAVLPADLALPLRRAREVLGREINPTVYSSAEFDRKRATKDHFLTRVLAEPRLVVLGNGDELGKAAR